MAKHLVYEIIQLNEIYVSLKQFDFFIELSYKIF